MRNQLEKKEYIKTYTVIPDFEKLGYEILAFTFIKMKSYPTAEETQKTTRRAEQWVGKHPNVIFAADGEGLGSDVIMVSFHRNYSKYADFMRSYAMEWAEIMSGFQTFLVSIPIGFKMKPFDLKYLADDE